MNNPISGAAYFFQGLKLIFRPGLRRYVIMPLLINVVVFAGLIWFGAGQFNNLMEWAMSYLPSWLGWLEWILWPIFALTVLLILFFTFSIFANIIAAPFNSYLSLAVERYITGVDLSNESSSQHFLLTIIPTVTNELKKLLYFLAWSIPFLVLFLIPVVNVIAAFTWFLFSAWMLALEYGDYPMGNNDILFTQQRKMLSQKRWLSFGFGSTVSVATMIPVVNFLVMPAAVTGATIMWLEKLKSTPAN